MASIVALLDTFDDAASLSRAAALADDMQRQRAVLQDELAAVERAVVESSKPSASGVDGILSMSTS